MAHGSTSSAQIRSGGSHPPGHLSGRRARLWAGLVVVALLAAAGGAAPAAARPAGPLSPLDEGRPDRTGDIDLATYPAQRWVVQLDGAPLAQAGLTGTRSTAGAGSRGRLDLAAGESRAYLARLERQQGLFRAELERLVPDARVERSFSLTVNGLAVRMSPEQAALVRARPGVKSVTPDVPFQPQMYSSPAQIGAPALWAQVGGQASAGEGVKVAVIDSGIFVTYSGGVYAGNPCFADAGYAAPPGYPKGDTRFTNNKVIVARAYFRPDDPPIPSDAQAIQGPGASPHGTHTAGTVACNAGTPATIQGANVTLTGIAPRAYLMNYRVFYQSTNPDDAINGNAFTVELVQAIEDAVADGADVISNSWGSSYQNTKSWPDPMVQAAEGAVAAGVVVVFSNGNAGDATGTTGSPAIAPNVISVGAATKDATIVPGVLTVTGSAALPPSLASPVPVGPAQFGPQVTTSLGPAGVVAAETVATNGSSLGCSLTGGASPFPDGSLAGKIPVIQRGTCEFSEKVYNAQRGGAVAALVYNSAAGGDNIQAMGAGAAGPLVTIPSWFMRRSQGLALAAYATANPASAAATFTYAPQAAPNIGNVMAGFSSRGPSTDKLLKPDVVAPGVDIVSAGYAVGDFPAPFTGFGPSSGTSMAAPHVSGAAAVLAQLHPDWTPAQVKSALMTTADEDVFLNTTQTVPAGVLSRGAGMIDLTKAGTPGLTLDQPSLSGGLLPAGQGRSFTVGVKDVSGVDATWTVSTTTSSGSLQVVPAAGAVAVPAGGTASLVVQVQSVGGAAPGTYEGSVVLTNAGTGRVLHLPVWLQVVPTGITAQVLLVDDDGSSLGLGLADYAAYYTNLLTSLGVTYTYVDVGTAAFPGTDTLFAHRVVLVFTGDNDDFATSGFTVADQDRLSEWLDAGGRLWATGQNLAEVTDSNVSVVSPRFGRSRLYHGYLGVSQEAPNVFPGGVPRPSADGAGPMADMRIDLSPNGDGIDNQASIEASAPQVDNDTYVATETVVPLLRQIGGAGPAGSGVAFGHSSEPSLEEERLKYDYRAAGMGFGLEGVNDGTGFTTGAQLARRTLDWLLDSVSGSVEPGGAVQAELSTFTAQATSSVGAPIVSYRWDFGDGRGIVSTTEASAKHRFVRPGTYVVRVEATDSLGHRGVFSRAVAVAPAGMGYRMVATDGGIFTFGDLDFYGSTGDITLNRPVVGMAPTPTGDGYWMVAADGGVFSFGDAQFHGSTGDIVLNRPVVGMAPTPTGGGYWLVASDGGIFAFGDAQFLGSTGDIVLNRPVVGMAASATGAGYWMVASDGGIFTFGDAQFLGSTGDIVLNQPVVGMKPTVDGDGYWLAATDGGVFTFGAAAFLGSMGDVPLNRPVVGIS